jgi:hypothetical protein
VWLVSLTGLSKEPAMSGTSGFQQDAQKGRPARPQQAKWRCVLCSVRRASERSENAAGGLFQHPARSAVFYLPPSTNRLLHEQQPRFGTGSWNRFRTHDPIARSTDISTKREMVPDTVSQGHPFRSPAHGSWANSSLNRKQFPTPLVSQTVVNI